MATCNTCGSTVSASYERVYSDNEGVLHACPECSTERSRRSGSTATPPDEWSEGAELTPLMSDEDEHDTDEGDLNPLGGALNAATSGSF